MSTRCPGLCSWLSMCASAGIAEGEGHACLCVSVIAFVGTVAAPSALHFLALCGCAEGDAETLGAPFLGVVTSKPGKDVKILQLLCFLTRQRFPGPLSPPGDS